MAQANQHDKTTPLSALFHDPFVADAFRRAEGDNPAPSLVPARRPEPVLSGTDAARIPEMA
jgi:hypothetical protein